MNTNIEKVRNILLDLDFLIIHEDIDDGIFVINMLDSGINNLIISCDDSIIIMEQFLFEVKNESLEMYKNLLIKNRDIIHGAFVMDKTGNKVIYRDTLQIENIDKNEIQGSINALIVLLSEYTDEIIKYSK